MKIAIDVSQVVYGTGVSQYTKELVANLLEIDQRDQFIVYGGALRRMYDLRKYLTTIKERNVRKVSIPISPRMADFIWNRVHRLHIEKLIGQVDVLHTSDWAQPPSRAFRVTTVHDLAPLKFPKVTPKRIVDVHKQKLEWVRKECERIIVPSETTKKDLLELGFDKERIRVIPEGPGHATKPVGKELLELTKTKYNLHKPYLLSVGINQRKNTARIIEAFLKVKKDLPLELVLVGKPGTEVKIADGVRLLGYVPDSDMPALYTGASALVYPSLYEGFGIPILDAFATKTPVVTSDIGSMKEIGKGAAILVDPESVESVVKGIERAITNSNSYILKGMARVKDYSWKKMAKETLYVYNEALKN